MHAKRMKIIDPPDWKRPKGYSNGILCPPGGSLLFISGQVGWDKNEQMQEGFLLQYRQALGNVMRIVMEAGGAATDITRLTFYVVDKREYFTHIIEVGKIYREIMGKHFPAMAVLEVKSLMEESALIEIEGTAVIY